MADKDTTYTDEQIADMRQAVAAADAKLAAEAAARRAAYLQPVEDLIGGDAYKAVLDGLNKLRDGYAADNMLSVHVDALAEIMPRLAAMAELAKTMTPATSAPQSPAEPA